MTLSEATYYLAEKLSGAIPENDQVFQIDGVRGTFVYYDAAQTQFTGEDDTGESELWVVSIRPGEVE
jgi:hypothetical protein